MLSATGTLPFVTAAHELSLVTAGPWCSAGMVEEANEANNVAEGFCFAPL